MESRPTWEGSNYKQLIIEQITHKLFLKTILIDKCFYFYFFYIYNITLLAQRPNFNIRRARISIYVYLSIFLKKKKKFIYQFVEYFIDEYEYECVGIDNRIFT